MLPEEKDTEAERKRIALEVISFCNTPGIVPLDKSMVALMFGADLTRSPKHPMSAVMLDQDVLCVIKSAYPNTGLKELMQFDSVMKVYWDDVAKGKKVMLAELLMEL